MIFEIVGQRLDGSQNVFLYDNETNRLSIKYTGFVFEFQDAAEKVETRTPYRAFSADEPFGKSKSVQVLKIQLGLSCNYSCEYCSQRFVARPEETTKRDIDQFISKLEHLEFQEEKGLKIEFWGGEPLVYLKTLIPLVKALDEHFKSWSRKPIYSVITNGSLLNDEICDWLIENQFSVAISHDGPGQSVRGPDPFDDEKTRLAVYRLYRALRPVNRISFNAMLSRSNTSRKTIYDWFVKFTGDPNVPLGEGSLVDAYDDGGYGNSLSTLEEHFAFRKQAFNDILEFNGDIGFSAVLDKVYQFTRDVLSHNEAKYLGQKCGMDNRDVLAVDLKGNVITCQNVSAVETAMNGESHKAGTIEDIEAVQVKTATHWSKRPDCPSCPVLHLCRGSCMYLQNKYWDISCANAYSDNIALLALSFEKITGGFIPVYIKADHLPPERRDIWGVALKHEEAKPRVIPIQPI